MSLRLANQNLTKVDTGLQASLRVATGGTCSANNATRAGLKELIATTSYPNWQAVKYALDNMYCQGGGGLAKRSHFQNEGGSVKVVGRYMWNPVGPLAMEFGGLLALQQYGAHLLAAGGGRLVFRCQGTFGKGMQILDLGDCHSATDVECGRTYLHRDWDNNRLNSLTCTLALCHGTWCHGVCL